MTAKNYHAMRYADLLLMAAECEVEAGSMEKARQYVNEVRTRAAAAESAVKVALLSTKFLTILLLGPIKMLQEKRYVGKEDLKWLWKDIVSST